MTPRKRKQVDESTYVGRFATRLRKLREEKKMSVEGLAEKSGIPRTTLYNWESAIRAPSIEMFPELCDALEVSIRKLMPPK